MSACEIEMDLADQIALTAVRQSGSYLPRDSGLVFAFRLIALRARRSERVSHALLSGRKRRVELYMFVAQASCPGAMPSAVKMRCLAGLAPDCRDGDGSGDLGYNGIAP